MIAHWSSHAQELKPLCLSSLVNLEELYLGTNSIQSLEGLSGLKRLCILVLDGNLLRHYNGDDLINLPLTALSARDCGLRGLFPIPPSIRSLYLDGNRVAAVDDMTVCDTYMCIMSC